MRPGGRVELSVHPERQSRLERVEGEAASRLKGRGEEKVERLHAPKRPETTEDGKSKETRKGEAQGQEQTHNRQISQPTLSIAN